ncbi:T9SS type A sorting domain-containing protein [Chitinophaga sp. sic0106]|uniref:T9SS type A sorting domain-containing protein n=1 Tax=Chitinophaga sp. sic0106 TaxID=2854785 RepID=UPI001C457E5D|nr:T9SS type A sorting domain-containing protein [Chitinophaga sp. sic0106]MBV7532913.1 T9SS type A sorting domain-containing protein [Chitinophaga sp. sic0106]
MRISILILFLLSCLHLRSSAQDGLYIPEGGVVWLYNNTQVGIFNSMINNGVLGSNPGSTFYILGKRWTNGTNAKLPDESADGVSGVGGNFLFSSLNPILGDVGQQTIFGNYNIAAKQGTSFPNMEVNNGKGIILDDLSDLKVRGTLHFTSGKIYLNGWNLMVGEKTPGVISGYTDSRYIVTGNTFAGGYLYRSAITSTANRVVFPVGSADNAYSPAAVLLDGGAKDNFGIRVFDSVYTVAIGGSTYRDSFVNKTWNIVRTDNSGGKATVILQHMDASEMTSYIGARDSSFITRFGVTGWDKLTVIPFKPQAGNLSTTTMLQPATMHMREFTDLGNTTYFAKTILNVKISPAIFLVFEASRVSPALAQLDWTTSREVNNLQFEVERRYEKDEAFTTIGVVPTKAVNGTSVNPLSYTFNDPNDYDDNTYYRIKATAKDGTVTYSEIKVVPPVFSIQVYPNPNRGNFHVKIRGLNNDMLLKMYDTWGQYLREYKVRKDADIQITHMPAGTYFLVLYNQQTEQKVKTIKVVVLP